MWKEFRISGITDQPQLPEFKYLLGIKDFCPQRLGPLISDVHSEGVIVSEFSQPTKIFLQLSDLGIQVLKSVPASVYCYGAIYNFAA